MITKGTGLRVVYCISSCIIATLLIIFTAIILFSLQNETEKYSQMLDNWNNSPIVSIYAITPYQSCQIGETSIFSYDWLGTKEGCFCKQSKKVKDTPCCSSKDADSDNCSQIKSVSGQKVDIWVTPNPQNNIVESNTQKLCAVRLLNYNFKNNAPQSLKCNSTEKWCGFDESGNKNADYGFCVDKQDACPINEIVISKTKLDNLKYEQVNLIGNSDYKLYVSRTSQNKLPLSEFVVSPSTTVCANRNKQTGFNLQYPLDRRDQQCGEYDYLFDRVGYSLKEKDLFEINKINRVVEQLPQFEYSSDEYSVFSKNYLNLKMSCRDDIENYYDYHSQIQRVETISVIIFTLCLIYALELICFETWIGFCYNKYLWGIIIFKKVNFFFKIIYILKFLLFIACNVVIIIQLVYYNKQSKFLNNTINGNCLDDITKNRFENLKKNMQSNLIVATIICLWIQILTEPNVCYLIGKCFGQQCGSEQQVKQQPSDQNTFNQQAINVQQCQPVYIHNPNVNTFNNSRQNIYFQEQHLTFPQQQYHQQQLVVQQNPQQMQYIYNNQNN